MKQVEQGDRPSMGLLNLNEGDHKYQLTPCSFQSTSLLLLNPISSEISSLLSAVHRRSIYTLNSQMASVEGLLIINLS